MTKDKKKLLEETYNRFMNAGLGQTPPETITGIIDENLMGFGTAIDEKIFSSSALFDLLARQKEQSAGLKISWEINPIYRYISEEENFAVNADDIFLHAEVDGNTIEIYMRFSIILEYRKNKWMVIHWHGSKPELVQSEEDTFGIETWKKKAEALEIMVSERTSDLADAKKRAEETLKELQITQSQLIQSEKMASLGELTAGIAHEIQNPLNFVNNFSEVSNELIDEMSDELKKGEIDEAKNIATDIKQNLEKINFHGKRADAIVKGMLQHSRTSNNKKEPTDINALCDEYLRLAYHGLRAKDKSFNATLKTEFDESIGNINIISQDIGRVILNLITNAFYAVDEKKKSGIEYYEPAITVRTQNSLSSGEGRGEVLISVQDNGSGIPQSIINKIFQPFFTTKPTGKGTGLGLSMSYDIIKSHGGELNAESIEGKGTLFIIKLPLEI